MRREIQPRRAAVESKEARSCAGRHPLRWIIEPRGTRLLATPCGRSGAEQQPALARIRTMPKALLRSSCLATTLLLAACSSSGSISGASQEAGGSPPEADGSPPEADGRPPEHPLPPPADAPPDIAQPADSSPDRSARADASQPDSGTSGLDAGGGQVLWEADPAKGIGVFSAFHMETDDLKTFFHTNPDPTGSSISAVPDGPYPSVWRFLKT